MKKTVLIIISLFTLVIISCNNSNTELSIEELAVEYQKAYMQFNYKSIEPYITEKSKPFAKGIFEDYPISAEKKEKLDKQFEGKDNKVIEKNINGNKAELIMCCNGLGDDFTTFWELENQEWKVDFYNTIKFNKEKYQNK